MVDCGGFYDRVELGWKEIQDSCLLICAAPPVGGRHVLTKRFTRRFNLLTLPEPTDFILEYIFS